MNAATTLDRGQQAPRLSPGRLVTFEGGEGGGKTTQIMRLAEKLAAAGIMAITTREPGGTPTAEAVRRFLLSGAAKSLGAEGEAVLFAAARADHIDSLIRPALKRGEWVLCDRFTDSTRAYQGAAGVDEALLDALERITVWPTTPDVTIILDIPVEIGMIRANRRAANAGALPDRFESDSMDEQRHRREVFLDIARREPKRCVVVDASRPESEVAIAIWREISTRLNITDETVNG